MRDSGEHDTLDDQIAYEQEHGKREYQWACELETLMNGMWENGPKPNTIYRATQLANMLRDALAPRPRTGRPRDAGDRPMTTTSYLDGGRNPPPYEPIRCCSCGKSQDEVRRLVSVSSALPKDPMYLCNECVDLMHELIHEED